MRCIELKTGVLNLKITAVNHFIRRINKGNQFVPFITLNVVVDNSSCHVCHSVSSLPPGGTKFSYLGTLITNIWGVNLIFFCCFVLHIHFI